MYEIYVNENVMKSLKTMFYGIVVTAVVYFG
jgi:hypothetical protein